MNNSFDDKIDSEEEEIMRKYKEKIGGSLGLNDSSQGDYQRKTVVQINEKEFFELIKNNKERVLVHFYNSDFKKCKELDKALE
jgi:hypothetical protein